MKDGYILGKDLLSKCSIDKGQLLEIIENGRPQRKFKANKEGEPLKWLLPTNPYLFQAYHPSYRPIRFIQHHWEDIHLDLFKGNTPPPQVPGEVPLVVNDVVELFPFLDECFFVIKEVEAIEELKKVKPLEKEQGKGEAENNLEAKLQEGRKKGGRVPKRIEPILEAVRKYMTDNPKHKTEQIVKGFKKYTSSQPFELTVDSKKYEIYVDGKKVCCSSNKGNKDKYHDKSIQLTTFVKNYIYKAKKT